MKSQHVFGFTLLELVTTLSLSIVLLAIAVYQLKELDDPLQNSAAELQGFLKQVRARAISTTAAYFVAPLNSKQIQATYADSCSNTTPTVDPKLQLEFPNGAWLIDTSWSICFNPRGFPDDNIHITLQDDDGATRTIEVYLGGAVREI